ncbi:MAG: FAD-dependent oxidoreductase [Pseudomonadota bacterium]
MEKFDVMVLGAGMVGLGTALHLRALGCKVVLVDRRGAAEETSYGNSGLIQAEAVMPYTFPRDLNVILGVLTGKRTDARIAWRSLAKTMPWIVRYALKGGPHEALKTAKANVPLVSRAVEEHRALSERADALTYWTAGGYLRIYNDPKAMEAAAAEDTHIQNLFGIPFNVWDREKLTAHEPHLGGDLVGAIHLPTPARIDDPGGLGKAYAKLFEAEGGAFRIGDANTLAAQGGGFVVDGANGPLHADQAVNCLGPWAGDQLKRFGVRVPLGVKRGYHRHYKAQGNSVLNQLIVEPEAGYVLAPQRRGIRLTTGAEFARRDDPPTPRQLERLEGVARALFPLAEPVEAEPWLGSRPCYPDLLPAIGPIPGVPGLWGNTGHHHLGFTLGPLTGRLLAQIVMKEDPLIDPYPYRYERFFGG